MRALIILLFVLHLFITGTSAQNNVSVDPLTGRVQMSVPIWQISEGDISVPIGLGYSGGGVRVEQGEGSGGIGWNLTAGGAVSRQLRGLPDDYNGISPDIRRGWLYNNNAQTIGSFNSTADENLNTCDDELVDYNFLDGLGFNQDTEPDVFNFYAPGLSGQFVFGNDGAIKVIPYQDLKITHTLNSAGAIGSITIQNNLGFTYFFSEVETSTRSAYVANSMSVDFLMTEYNQYQTPLTFYYSWKLSKITSPSGAEILFTHTLDDVKSSIRKVTVYNEVDTTLTLYTIKDSYRQSRINQISSTLLAASFDWEENRISSISIRDNFSTDERNFNFYYVSVKDYRDTGFYATRRSFLEKIMQEENCITFPAYEFTYQGVSFGAKTTELPWKNENMQDYWGYYNGTSSSKVPDIYVYNSQSNAEHLRLRPIPGQSEDQYLDGANRVVGAPVIATGSIKTISYPSGSTTTLDYEPNSFFDELANDTVQGGGVRVKKITISNFERGSDDIVSTYSYKQANGITSGQLTYRPVYAIKAGSTIMRTADDQAPEGEVLYSRTSVKQTGRGSTVYEFLIPAMYPATSYSTDWTASKSKIAREPQQQGMPCMALGNQTIGYYSYPFAPNRNYDFERGIIKKVSNYSESAVLVSERSFDYERLSTTAVSIKALKYDKVIPSAESNFVFSPYQLLANVGKVMITETAVTADEITPANQITHITNYLYNTTHQMLESVSSTNSNGIIYKTKHLYAKDFNITSPDPSKSEVVAIKSLNDNFRHGVPIETISYRKEGSTESVIGASLNYYKDFGDKILLDKSFGFPPIAGYTPTTVTGTTNQQLSHNTNYKESTRINSYNALGLPISTTDTRKNKAGIHYGYGNTVPVAMVANAIAEETVYDGFETPTSFNLSVSGSTTASPGWTGNSSLHVTSSNSLTRSGISKGGSNYILSFWAKPNTTGQLDYLFTGGSGVSGSVPYISAGQWKYYEKVINISGVSSLFSFQLSSTVSADIDEIKLYPSHASMSSTTLKPLGGATSTTNDRGISGFKEYDEIGREKATLDRNKNLVQLAEYMYKKELSAPLLSNFSNDWPANQTLHLSDDVTFTAPVNCIDVTYLWTITSSSGLITSTASSINYVFTEIGNHNIELTVTGSNGATSTTVQSLNSYCVEPESGGNITFGAVDQTISHCEVDGTRTISVVGLTGCHTTPEEYKWYYRLNSSVNWVLIGYTFKTVDFNIQNHGSESFAIKCEIASNCIIDEGKCAGTYPFYAENTIGFTYDTTGDCM